MQPENQRYLALKIGALRCILNEDGSLIVCVNRLLILSRRGRLSVMTMHQLRKSLAVARLLNQVSRPFLYRHAAKGNSMRCGTHFFLAKRVNL